MSTTLSSTKDRPAKAATSDSGTKVGKRHYGTHIFLIVMSIVWLTPLVWTLITALRPRSSVNEHGYFSLKGTFNFDNFTRAWNQAGLGKYFINSLIITVPTVLLTDPTNGNQFATTSTTGVFAAGGKLLTATFSLAMNPASITAATFTLAPVGGATLGPASVTYNASTNTATLRTALPLLPNTSYTAIITTGATSAAPAAAPFKKPRRSGRLDSMCSP